MQDVVLRAQYLAEHAARRIARRAQEAAFVARLAPVAQHRDVPPIGGFEAFDVDGVRRRMLASAAVLLRIDIAAFIGPDLVDAPDRSAQLARGNRLERALPPIQRRRQRTGRDRRSVERNRRTRRQHDIFVEAAGVVGFVGKRGIGKARCVIECRQAGLPVMQQSLHLQMREITGRRRKLRRLPRHAVGRHGHQS